MCLSGRQTDARTRRTVMCRTFIPTSSLTLSLCFLIFCFFLPKSCSRGGARCVSGQVMGNDTTEQSLNFSQRAGPLNLQVAVSFRRQCLNIVAIFNSHGPDIFSSPSTSRSAKETSGLLSRLFLFLMYEQCQAEQLLPRSRVEGKNAVICSYPQTCAVVFLALVSALPA